MTDEWPAPVRDQSGNIVIISEPMLQNGVTARVRAWLDNEHSSFPVPEDDIRTLLTIVEPTQRGDQVAAEKIEAGWVVGLEYGYDLSRIALSAIYLAMNTQEQSND